MSSPLLLAMAAASGVAIANFYYIQPLLSDIARTFGVSAGAMGAVATVGQIGFALGMLLFVPLGDIRDRRALILVMFAGAAISLTGMALAPSPMWLAVAMASVGAFSVTGQMFVPLAAHLSPPETRGAAVGIVMGGLLAGILVSRTISGYIAALAGWRTMFWIASGLTVTVAAIMGAALPRSTAPSRIPYGRLIRSLWELTRAEPILREAALTGAMLFGAFSAFWSMLSFHLETPPLEYGSQVAGLFGLIGIVGVAAAPIAGRLADRLDPRVIVRVMLLVTASGFVIFAMYGDTIAGLIIGVILLDAGVQAGHVTSLSRVHALSAEARNRMTTIYMVAFFSGGALGSAVSAFAWSRWGWLGVCAAGVVMPLLAATVLFRGPHTAGRV